MNRRDAMQSIATALHRSRWRAPFRGRRPSACALSAMIKFVDRAVLSLKRCGTPFLFDRVKKLVSAF